MLSQRIHMTVSKSKDEESFYFDEKPRGFDMEAQMVIRQLKTIQDR
jgi:hypothetical protein